MTEGNDVKHSRIGLNSCFSASQNHALTLGDSIAASRHVHLLANLGDLQGVNTIFNKGVDTHGF